MRTVQRGSHDGAGEGGGNFLLVLKPSLLNAFCEFDIPVKRERLPHGPLPGTVTNQPFTRLWLITPSASGPAHGPVIPYLRQRDDKALWKLSSAACRPKQSSAAVLAPAGVATRQRTGSRPTGFCRKAAFGC